MSKLVRADRTAREKLYGTLALILGPPLWALLALGVVAGLANPQAAPLVSVYVTYAVLFAIGYWIVGAAYRATAFGNMILLGPDQLPELHAMVLEGAMALELRPPPKAFLYNSNGLINAFARRLLGGRYVFLTSALVEVESDEQVRFVIGHELAHHAAGHLSFWRNLLRLPAYAIPFLQPAYSRAREYTCDRIGARLMGEAAVPRSALMMLGCGCGRVNRSLSCEAFMAQEKMVPPIFGFLTEICRSHPRLTRRLAALTDLGPAREVGLRSAAA
jgi:Zn-dependent protease with chaperone function